MGDYHVHLHPHGPAGSGGPPSGEYPPGHIEAYVETALSRGSSEVGFTEHLYRCVEATDLLGRFWERESRRDLAEHTAAFVAEERFLSLDRYVAAIVNAKERGLPVLLGLEVDFFPETIEAVTARLAEYPFDLLIGSVHWIGGWAVDHSEQTYEFERRGVDRAYEEYFALVADLARSGSVDVLAHVDVVKKHGHRPIDEPVQLWEDVVSAAAASGVAVEVSTAGLHRPASELYPGESLLAMFHDAAVPITLASDAHYPHEAARDRHRAVEAARIAGYTTHVRFDRRTRIDPAPI